MLEVRIFIYLISSVIDGIDWVLTILTQQRKECLVNQNTVALKYKLSSIFVCGLTFYLGKFLNKFYRNIFICSWNIMKYGKIDPEAGDEEEQKYDEKKRKAESDKKSFQTKINIEGHLYDLEDGQVVNYIEIYIPFLRRYCRINACDFFQYLFGKFSL